MQILTHIQNMGGKKSIFKFVIRAASFAVILLLVHGSFLCYSAQHMSHPGKLNVIRAESFFLNSSLKANIICTHVLWEKLFTTFSFFSSLCATGVSHSHNILCW